MTTRVVRLADLPMTANVIKARDYADERYPSTMNRHVAHRPALA
jgi:hypothetical protein